MAGDKYNKLIREKTVYYANQYDIEEAVAKDIIIEGWDIACEYFENDRGLIKLEHIKRQYPELFVGYAKKPSLKGGDTMSNMADYYKSHDIEKMAEEDGRRQKQEKMAKLELLKKAEERLRDLISQQKSLINSCQDRLKYYQRINASCAEVTKGRKQTAKNKLAVYKQELAELLYWQENL